MPEILRKTRPASKHAAPRRLELAAVERRLRAGRDIGPHSVGAHLAIDDVEVKADGEGGPKTYGFTISTAVIDRDRDVIAVDGWHTDAFMKAGGPVLFGHGYDSNGTMPIGRATKVFATSKALKAEMQFIPGDPFAERVQRAVDFGALRATSVGFRPFPGRAAWNEERQGIDFIEHELLEFSLVPVPANPDALREKSAGGIRDFGTGVLAQLHGVESLITFDPHVYLTHVEALRKALDLALVLGKRGRVLSSANEQRIRGAHGHGEQLVAALSEVIAQVEAIVEEVDDVDQGAAVEPVVLRLLPDPEPRYSISPSDVHAATVRALTDLVAAEVRRHTGRLD